MPSPKSGTAGSAVAPISPKVPHEADKADPGEMAKVKAQQKESQTGKYGAPEETPHKKSLDDEEKASWIEIELVDEESNGVPGEPFKIILPDDTVFSGTLSEKGLYRLEASSLVLVRLRSPTWIKTPGRRRRDGREPMGQPAARVGDMHACPMVTPGAPPIPHVGGPVMPPGCPTVLIRNMPAARVGDMATCVGPPDTITGPGSATVLIGSMSAACMGDMTAHGGSIVMGFRRC